MDLTRRILCFILYSGLAVLAEATLPGHSTGIASSSASTPVTTPTSTTSSFPSTPPPIVYQWLYGLVAPDWNDMNCSLPAATDGDMDPLERWEQLKVEDAWNAAVDNWNTKGNDGATQFSQSLGSFFEYTETLFCENLADNDGCSNLQVKCDEFNHPAGYMIVLSMIWLERQYLGINSAISAGSNAVSEQLSDMLGTFAPLKEEGLSVDNIILDIISLGFSLSMSPMWNKVFKESKLVATKINNKDLANELGTVKDWVNPLVTQSITILKDTNTAAGTQLANEEALDTAIGTMSDQWQSGLNDSVGAIFNGSSDSIDLLYNTIKDGMFFSFNGVASDYDLQKYVETALYAYLIPQAWSLADEGPFILDTGSDCVDGKASPSEQYAYRWFSTDDVTDPWYCYDNKAYYLVAAEAKNYKNSDGSSGGINHGFFNLPGADKLDGSAYGGITVENIINGTLNGYFSNGEKNGWAAADTSDETTIDDIFYNGITTSGVFTLPVCGAIEAWTNWHYYSTGARDKTDNYPCN